MIWRNNQANLDRWLTYILVIMPIYVIMGSFVIDTVLYMLYAKNLHEIVGATLMRANSAISYECHDDTCQRKKMNDICQYSTELLSRKKLWGITPAMIAMLERQGGYAQDIEALPKDELIPSGCYTKHMSDGHYKFGIVLRGYSLLPHMSGFPVEVLGLSNIIKYGMPPSGIRYIDMPASTTISDITSE